MLVCVNKCHVHLTCMHAVEKYATCNICKKYGLCYDFNRYFSPHKKQITSYLDERRER